jgi:hypothetical protein
MSTPLRACRPRLTAAQGPRVEQRASMPALGAQPLRGYESKSDRHNKAKRRKPKAKAKAKAKVEVQGKSASA